MKDKGECYFYFTCLVVSCSTHRICDIAGGLDVLGNLAYNHCMPYLLAFFHPKSLSTILAHPSLTIFVALPMTYFISTNNVNHHTSSISHHSIVPLLGLYISYSLLLFIVYLWIVCIKPYFGPLFFCLVSPSSLFSLVVFSFSCNAFPIETHQALPLILRMVPRVNRIL